jgi:hypothetical protein
MTTTMLMGPRPWVELRPLFALSTDGDRLLTTQFKGRPYVVSRSDGWPAQVRIRTSLLDVTCDRLLQDSLPTGVRQINCLDNSIGEPGSTDQIPLSLARYTLPEVRMITEQRVYP